MVALEETVESEGLLWVIAFLKPDSRLSYQDRIYLMTSAASMCFNEETERKVTGENFEGVLYTKGKHYNLGMFGGQQFEADLDTNDGQSSIRFLVARKHDPRLN